MRWLGRSLPLTQQPGYPPEGDKHTSLMKKNQIDNDWTDSHHLILSVYVGSTRGMGFPQLAHLVAKDADHETYIFRSFDQLATRTLLQMQSELALLEKEQEQLDHEAAKLSSDRHVQMMLTRWESLDRLGEEGKQSINVRRRIQLADEITTKLERYFKFLGVQSQLAKYERPSNRVLKAYRSLFYGADGNTPQLYEPLQAKALKSEDHDYIALNPPTDRDLMSRVLRDHFPAHTDNIYSNESGIVKQYEGRWLEMLATVCSIAIATILLIASILLLYFFRGANVRLALVLAFIVLFAIGVSLTTAATRDSVFAATAAYAAVLIVFVSGNLGDTNTGTFVGYIMGDGVNSTVVLNGTMT